MFLMQSEVWRLRDLLQSKALSEARDVLSSALGTYFPNSICPRWNSLSNKERKGFVISYALMHGNLPYSAHKTLSSVQKAYNDIVFARGQKSAVGLLSFVRGVATFQEREVSLLYAEACKKFSRHQRLVYQDKIIRRSMFAEDYAEPFKLRPRAERPFVSQL